MPKTRTTSVLLAVLVGAAVMAAVTPATCGGLTPALAGRLAAAPDGAMLKVLVPLADQVDVAALDHDLHQARTGKSDRHRLVVTALQERARASQAPLLAELARKTAADVRGYRPLWLINAVVVSADAATIRELAARPDVGVVEPFPEVRLIEPVAYEPADKSVPHSGAVPDGVASIRAHEVWHSFGIDGTGTIVGGLDTGVDVTHPALTDRWLARDPDVLPREAWFIPGSFGDPKIPSDEHGHGTHTMGTMLGATATDSVGVAPGARWIASNAIYNLVEEFDAGILAAMEFFADPDGDPLTSDDIPDVINNSWGLVTPDTARGYVDCESIFWAAIDNIEAGGTVMVFSAGNEGPGAGTLRMPADRATTATNAFSVGSVSRTPPFTVSGFSSRGPSACGGPYAMKPEVAAPGSSILSTWPGGGYAYLSGTSMAGPHVAGTVALMRQANPDADPLAIKQALMATARDIAAPGEDNDSGWGVIDAYAAVLEIMPHTGRVSGVVTDGDTGLPLAGALLARVGGVETIVTGPDGAFDFHLPSGDHQFVARLFGYDDVVIDVTVLDDQTAVVEAVLPVQPPAVVSGVVTDPDGAPVVGATVSALDTPLAPVTTDGEGRYTITVPAHPLYAYAFWATASGLGFIRQEALVTGDMTLDFSLPPDTTEDFETNNLFAYPWYQTDDSPFRLYWVTAGSAAWEGAYGARSGAVPNGYASGLAIDYDCAEAGTISFWQRVSSEEGYDFLHFSIDGTVVASWSGEQPWEYASFPVSAGLHTFKWEYVKDGGGALGEDAAYIDYVTFPLAAVPPAPMVGLDTSNVAATVAPDATVSIPVTVFNSGAVGLEFKARVLATTPGKDAGVDPFGYVWRDSDEPDGPTYAWLDITADGTNAGVADDALLGPFPLGFSMPFYGAVYDSVWIGTNGFLSFTGDSHDYRNTTIPTGGAPDGMIAFFWDDMRSNQGGTILYRAEPDSGRFVVQYQDVIRYATATPHTMQVILGADGDIVLQYADVTEPLSATVGIENAGGTVGTMVAYNDPGYLHAGLAIRFDYPGQVAWATVVPDSGAVAPGANLGLELVLDATGLPEGIYYGELALFCNDPAQPVHRTPVVFTVSAASAVGDVPVPREVVFRGAVPNPFNPRTELRFGLPRESRVELGIYDVAGRLVRRLVSERLPAGEHAALWDGRTDQGGAAASGVYFARLAVDGTARVRRMALVR